MLASSAAPSEAPYSEATESGCELLVVNFGSVLETVVITLTVESVSICVA